MASNDAKFWDLSLSARDRETAEIVARTENSSSDRGNHSRSTPISFEAVAAHRPDFGVAAFAQRAAAVAPAWAELRPEVSPESDADAAKLVQGAEYLASRGPDGLPELKRWIMVAAGRPWLRQLKVLKSDRLILAFFISSP